MADITQISLNGSVYDLRDKQFRGGITNCITEIPQDINLELNAGILTLKAGSKVYKPNGVGVYDEITVPADRTFTYSYGADTWLVFYTPGGSIDIRDFSKVFSGSTEPAQSINNFWYDTTNNVIKKYYDSAWHGGYSFPIAIITTNASKIVSIDQVFNGLGYIGSTVFALPGFSVLAPNGRNTDGTLKNISWTGHSVITRTESDSSGRTYLALNTTNGSFGISQYQYDELDNYNKINGVISKGRCIVAQITNTSGGRITSFNPKTAFHAVDYSDTEYIAHQSMPSNRYVDLTLPASDGTISDFTITAPADGYLYFNKVSSASGQRIKLNNTNGTEASVSSWSSATSQALEALLLVSKGDVIRVNCNAGGTKNYFRFIYANGSK